MALKERGKLVETTAEGWKIHHDEGTISLTDEINKTVEAEARRKKKSRASINNKIQAELIKHENQQVEIELSDNGDFRVEQLKLERV